MKRLRELLRLVLLSKWLPVFVFGLALVLCLPALSAGLMLDDIPMQMMFQPDFPHQPGGPRGDWDLFRFLGPDRSYLRYQMELGLMPWWTAPTIRIAFFRPLSSLHMAIDFRNWADKPWLLHLESLLLYAGLALATCRLYRQLFGVTIAAGLAAVMFAIDDAHSLPVVWLSNRNALWATCLGVLSLSSFVAMRRGTFSAGKWLSPILFALALLSGEAALGAAAYLFAYVVWVEEGSLWDRLSLLVPYVAIGLVWAGIYGALGYGTVDSGMYIDPLRSPVQYLIAVGSRLPLLLLAQLAVPPADLWMQLSPEVQVQAGLAAWLLLALAGLFGVRLLRGDRLSGFFATGMILSLLPVCSAWPMDRLLLFSGLGAFGLLAQLLLRLRNGLTEPALSRPGLRKLAIGVLVLVHIVLAGLLLPARIAFINKTFGGLDERAAMTLPSHEKLHGKTLVFVNSPDPLVASYSVVYRYLHGRTLIHDLRLLSSVLRGSLTITRTDERTLVVWPSAGFFQEPLSRVFRSATLPFAAGDKVTLSNLTAEVLEASSEGTPQKVAYHFDRPLEDAQLTFVSWVDRGFVPFVPPAVGQTVTLPAIDYAKALGSK